MKPILRFKAKGRFQKPDGRGSKGSECAITLVEEEMAELKEGLWERVIQQGKLPIRCRNLPRITGWDRLQRPQGQIVASVPYLVEYGYLLLSLIRIL